MTTILYYTILYYTILYYTILYYTRLYYIALYCTIPYHVSCMVYGQFSIALSYGLCIYVYVMFCGRAQIFQLRSVNVITASGYESGTHRVCIGVRINWSPFLSNLVRGVSRV